MTRQCGQMFAALLLAVVMVGVLSGPLQAATYTWVQGGDITNWEDPLNWDANGVPPQSETNATLVFSASTTGQIGGDPPDGKVTIGAMSWETSFSLQDFGHYTDYSSGIFVNTGTDSPATATISNGAHMIAYYVNWDLTSDLELSGSGKLTVRAYNGRGVEGSGGFIVNSGTSLDCVRTHGNDDYVYAGGVTIRSGGIVNTTGRGSGNGALGTGRLTIEEGGQIQTVNDLFGANDATFVIDGSTDGTGLFITGAGGNWNASGTWTFDLSGLAPDVGDMWNIISGTATYDPAFSISDFTEESDGVWTGEANGAAYEFEESTGILQVTAVGPGGTTLIVR